MMLSDILHKFSEKNTTLEETEEMKPEKKMCKRRRFGVFLEAWIV
jgi:hypothetical protein